MLAGLLVAGCGEPVDAPVRYEVRLAAGDVWSGGTLTLIAQAFRPPAALPALTLDELTLALRRVDDTTAAADLPDAPGEYRVSLDLTDADVEVVPAMVRLYGFRDRVDGPPLKGNLHVWPTTGQPTVLGVAATGPAAYNLATGATQAWPDSIHGAGCNLGGIGRSWRADHFVFQAQRPGAPMTECYPYRAWRLLPAPEPASDALPTPEPAFQSWSSAEVAPGRWLFTTDGHSHGYDCRTGACLSSLVDLYSIGGGPFIVPSPRGDRVLVGGNARVLDPETLSILYAIEGLQWAWDAGFSPDGDTLITVGFGPVATGIADRVLVAASDDGRLLAEIDPVGPDGTPLSPDGIAYDPAGPWIYVAGSVELDTLRLPAVLVVDRRTLQPIALMRTPPDQAYRGFPDYDGVRIVPAPLEGAVFIVGVSRIYDPPSTPTIVYRFDRVP
jgi:hypothetical protein